MDTTEDNAVVPPQLPQQQQDAVTVQVIAEST